VDGVAIRDYCSLRRSRLDARANIIGDRAVVDVEDTADSSLRAQAGPAVSSDYGIAYIKRSGVDLNPVSHIVLNDAISDRTVEGTSRSRKADANLIAINCSALEIQRSAGRKADSDAGRGKVKNLTILDHYLQARDVVNAICAGACTDSTAQPSAVDAKVFQRYLPEGVIDIAGGDVDGEAHNATGESGSPASAGATVENNRLRNS